MRKIIAIIRKDLLLRFESPLQLNNRRLTAEVEISDRVLGAGSFVTLGIGAANRDPAEFADPERLDVGRRPNNHLAFGQGAHSCLGAPLARLEGQIALTTLFQRFPHLRLAQPAESLRWRRNLFLRALEELPVAF